MRPGWLYSCARPQYFRKFYETPYSSSGDVASAKESGAIGGATPPTSTEGQETTTTAETTTKVSLSGLSGAEVWHASSILETPHIILTHSHSLLSHSV